MGLIWLWHTSIVSSRSESPTINGMRCPCPCPNWALWFYRPLMGAKRVSERLWISSVCSSRSDNSSRTFGPLSVINSWIAFNNLSMLASTWLKGIGISASWLTCCVILRNSVQVSCLMTGLCGLLPRRAPLWGEIIPDHFLEFSRDLPPSRAYCTTNFPFF